MSKASRLFVYLCLPCLALCLALTALAGNAHNFGGDVKILKVTEEPDNNVKVRLSLHIINNSGADVNAQKLPGESPPGNAARVGESGNPDQD